jgi:hypothetical protein
VRVTARKRACRGRRAFVCYRAFVRYALLPRGIASDALATLTGQTAGVQAGAIKQLITFSMRTYGIGPAEGTRDSLPRGVPRWFRFQHTKAYIYLLAFLDRRSDVVPEELQADYRATLKLVPPLAEEFCNASCMPRVRGRVRLTPNAPVSSPGSFMCASACCCR